MIIIVTLFFCAGGLAFFRTKTKTSPIETEEKETESRDSVISIETKPQISTPSRSRNIHTSFDTTEFE